MSLIKILQEEKEKEEIMKKHILLTISFIMLTGIFCTLSSSGQTLELGANQTFTVSSPGFFPFSSISNEAFKEMLPTDPTVSLQFSNFLGSPCLVAPANDFSENGPQIRVDANGVFIIDFSGAGPNAGSFGLSLVPEGGACIFDLLTTLPPVTTTSSSGGIVIGPGDDVITPNGLTVFGGFLSDTVTDQLSNEMSNPNCQNSPFGIEPLVINGRGGDDIFNVILNDIGVPGPQGSQRVLNQLTPSQDELFTLTIPENKKAAMTVYNQKLVNKTDMTKIYVTGVFPSFSETNPLMIGRVLDSRIDVTLKEQIDPALAAVQHAIVSATMPWQLSKPNGFFITQGGGCVGPYCVIVEQGMIVVDPDGACTPEKLNKRRAGYKTFNPSKFFDPFPASQATIQIPADDIVDPKHPLVSKVVRDNAYLILQPVPPQGKFVQQLKLNLREEDD